MKSKYLYVALFAVLAVVAVIGALMTPLQAVIAQNPYVVGGEIEAPQPVSVGGSTDVLVVAIAAVALIIGVVIASKFGR